MPDPIWTGSVALDEQDRGWMADVMHNVNSNLYYANVYHPSGIQAGVTDEYEDRAVAVRAARLLKVELEQYSVIDYA